MQIMQQRNAVELQYHLLRKTGRPLTGGLALGAPPPLPLSSSPPFMLPSTSARPLGPPPLLVHQWPQGTFEQQQQQHAFMQLQRAGVAVPAAAGALSPPFSPFRPSFGVRTPKEWVPSAPPVHERGGEEDLKERVSSLYQMQLSVHPEKPRPTVDPAVLYEKTGIDLAVQHLRDEGERMHLNSREMTRKIMQQQQINENEKLKNKYANPLLVQLSAEQQRLIEEQLRCIDEVIF